MRVLIMGGTRFIGVHLCQQLVAQDHEVVLFNRGNRPAPVPGITQIHGDRRDAAGLQAKLAGEAFDAVFDNTGRELADTQPLVELLGDRIQQFIYVSSAGVYAPSECLPLRETDPVDPKSRHWGKAETEAYLQAQGVPFTSVRPVYIYGPGNYNDIEAWFFDRITHGRPIPLPNQGLYITQLGHVADLAAAMVACLGNPKAMGQVYNIADSRYTTFRGLAQACATAAGRDARSLELVSYDPDRVDGAHRKAFPLRQQHFFTSIEKALTDLDWRPQYDLAAGLKDSYENDYLAAGRDQKSVDFSVDEILLGP